MKWIFVSALFSLASAFAAPIIIDAPVNHLFIPNGFDNNDNVELVVTGHFPSTCYSAHKNEVTVTGDLINIHVTAILKESQASCDRVLVQFKEVVNVGNLQGGDYRVVVNGSTPNELKDELFIDEATSGNTDDYVYAVVDYIDLGFTGGAAGSAQLVAKTPSDCYVLDKVEYLSNKKDTLSILPIMKKISANCSKKSTNLIIPLSYDMNQFKTQQILLFSRTVQGKSVNALVDR